MAIEFEIHRKAADRLGKDVFVNEVSIGGVGRLPRCTEISRSGGDKGGHLDFFRRACTTRQFGDGGVRFSLGPLKAEGKR